MIGELSLQTFQHFKEVALMTTCIAKFTGSICSKLINIPNFSQIKFRVKCTQTQGCIAPIASLTAYPAVHLLQASLR